MKAREQVIRLWIRTGVKFEAAVAIVAASIAPQVGYDASKRFAVKMGCPIALWRIACLCEIGRN